ncbi:hypothetical protein B0H17DRAFT_1137087 [Mycena rosella]|uniref:Uncharacterized protein n=1 Tax=Mycena rosella TaxID=1033263 RepID=A0AAD7D9I4_MYCRO|nr:hypothetical protein B0H17DRAFT_1137087 [Mycena rosella]
MPDEQSAEVIRIRAAAWGTLVEQLLDNKITSMEFIERIRETGASPEEANEYAEQARSPSSAHPSREGTPEGLSEQETTKFRAERDALLAERAKEDERRRTAQVAEDLEWRVLHAKINILFPTSGASTRPNFTPADLAQFLGLQSSSSPTSIPAATLSAAPHLAELTAGVRADLHMEQIWKLRRAYGSDKALDRIVDLMQLQDLVDPLPRSIWKSIIQDLYVDFEKVFSALLSE